MRPITSGLILERCGMRLGGELGPGSLGQRWSVQLVHQQPGVPVFVRVAEIVETRNPSVKVQCDRLTRLVGAVRSRGVAAPIATEWIDDDHFAAIWDPRPEARTLKSLMTHPDFSPPFEKEHGEKEHSEKEHSEKEHWEQEHGEQEFWSIAAMLYRALSRLHRAGIAHGALSPETIYFDGDSLLLGDLWWTRSLDGPLRESSASSSCKRQMPEAARRWFAPEILRGEVPTRESDLFSLGAVLHELLTGDPQIGLDQPHEGRSDFPAHRRDSVSERSRFTLALMQQDPAKRLNRLQIEAWLNEKLLSGVKARFPKDWKMHLASGFGVSLHGLAVGQPVEIFDLYHYAHTLQLGCRHEEREAWFSVEGLLLTGGRTYLALADSPEYSERLDDSPFTVVCLEEDWRFRTVTDQELFAVQEDLTENVYRSTARNPEYAQFLLGPIRAWSRPEHLSPGQLDTTDWTPRPPERL